jgi:hypothetical protein
LDGGKSNPIRRALDLEEAQPLEEEFYEAALTKLWDFYEAGLAAPGGIREYFYTFKSVDQTNRLSVHLAPAIMDVCAYTASNVDHRWTGWITVNDNEELHYVCRDRSQHVSLTHTLKGVDDFRGGPVSLTIPGSDDPHVLQHEGYTWRDDIGQYHTRRTKDGTEKDLRAYVIMLHSFAGAVLTAATKPPQ